MDIPTSLADITPEYLTIALGTEVVDLSVAPMPGMVCALGEVGILTVDHGGDPKRFVAKLPLETDVAQMYNAAMNFYARESGWYRHAAAVCPLRSPAALINEHDPDSGRALLILEMAETEDKGDILNGASYERHAQAIEVLAAHHAALWETPGLTGGGWLWDWSNPGWLAGHR